MSRIPAVDPATARGKVKELLDAVNRSLGVTPNLFRVAAQSPVALEGLVSLNATLGNGELSVAVREAIALAVAEANACSYCLSAHTLLGKGAGLSEAEIAAARDGTSADLRLAVALNFSQKVVRERGQVNPGDVGRMQDAGYTEGQIVEIVANIALNIFTNLINNVADTTIDFPIVVSSQPRRHVVA